MDGLNRDFSAPTALNAPVYHVASDFSRHGLEELKQLVFAYDVEERLPYEESGGLALDTLITRIDEYAHSGPSPDSVRLMVAFAGPELELLQAVARAKPEEMPVGKLCHVLFEQVSERFDVWAEQREVAAFLGEAIGSTSA